MGVTQTSLLAYSDIKKKLGNKQRIVRDAIGELGIANNQMIAEYLNWPINCVTGRVKELRDKGFVTTERIDKNQFGRRVLFWCLCDPNDRKLKKMLEQDCEA